jgi:hypothetical protein
LNVDIRSFGDSLRSRPARYAKIEPGGLEMRSAQRSFVVVACMVLTVGSLHCSSTSKTGTSTGASQTIGPAGGKLTSADGAWDLTVPANALPSSTTITVKPTSVTGAIGTAYELEPSGTTFAVPVTMTFHYGTADLGGAPADAVVAAVFGDGGWTALDGYTLDTTAKTVSGTTTHLSTYGGTAGCGAAATPHCTGCAVTCSWRLYGIDRVEQRVREAGNLRVHRGWWKLVGHQRCIVVGWVIEQ